MVIDKDFSEVINKALSESADYTDRAHSFDFCYLYFRQSPKVIKQNMEASCYALWSYLASWGMLRGSAELLQKNPSCLKELVNHIQENDLTDIDLDNYSEEKTRKRLLQEYNEIDEILRTKCLIKRPSLTLVTKIMLGVYSCIPAFDNRFNRYYKEEFGHGVTRLTDKVLKNIATLAGHVVPIDKPLIQFSGEHSNSKYNKIKTLDLYGWIKEE